MTCPHCVSAGEFFGDRIARRELARLRKRGPSRMTRLLLDALVAEGVEGATLLDVGGGVGAIQLELLEAGAARAVSVDASAAYREAARDEARRRGVEGRIDYLTGDLVELADEVEEADVVTLDRVLCCYPDVDALVDASASRARRVWGVVFPRDRRLVRWGAWLANLWQRLRRDPFRAYVHPTERVVARARRHGLEPVMETRSFVWQVRVFRRVA